MSTTSNLSVWAQANTALRNKDYGKAKELYKKALDEADNALKAKILFNLEFTRRQIGYRSAFKEFINESSFLKNPTHRAIFFDADFYRENNPDVKGWNGDLESHYWSFGEREGRFPNPYFDPIFYLNTNADVRVAQRSPFRHFIDAGFKERRLGKKPLPISNRQVLESSKPLLFVGHDGIQAGSEVVLLEVIRWFYENTLRRIKLLLLEPGPLVNRYANYADIYVLPKGKIDNPVVLKEFLNENFQFAYLNTVVSGRFLREISDLNVDLKTHVIAHIHEMEKVLEIFSNDLHFLKQGVTHWISASPATTEALIDKHGIRHHDITTVPAFIQPVSGKNVNHNEHRSEARRVLGLSEEAFVVMGCGTIYWRKGTDIFIETAKNLRQITHRSIIFVWLGQGPDQSSLESSLSEEEKRFIKFAGNREDANKLLAAADIFFLSSREDPFPLVVLESAQHGVPAICFAPSTGITAFIEQDAGIALEDISAESATNALNELLRDAHKRQKLGEKARKKLFEGYSAEIQIPKIYDAVLHHAGYRPSVTVIVPLYNHERFVQDRMDSITLQSIKDFEIIILDDCSIDETVARITPYLSDNRVQFFKNNKNSGTPFKQWEKGISLAKGEIIWIAEGDDSCDRNFLFTLLPYFNDPMINIASSRVEIINEQGEVIPDALIPYLEMAYPGKFKNSYICDGFVEVNQQLGAMCTLVNASGLLIRKSSFGENLNKANQYKMCGDWLIYLECLLHGIIAYDVNTTNYFRRHTASQVSNIEGTSAYFSERYKITEYVLNNYNVTKELVNKAFMAIEHEWARFRYKNQNRELNKFYNKATLKALVKHADFESHVAFYVHGMLFSKGGIERLASQLANHLVEKGWRVTIYCRENVNRRAIYPLYKSIRLVPIFNEDLVGESIKTLRHALTKDKVDIFIPMLSEWLFEPIVDAAQQAGVKIIVSEHNDPWKIEELWWSHEKRVSCFAKADRIHLLLDEYKTSLPDYFEKKITVISNGIKINKKPLLEKRERVIIAVGRLVAQKRFDRLIDAIELVAYALRENNYSVAIYGEGQLRKPLEEHVKDIGLNDIIAFNGNTECIENAYRRADFIVLPSEFEGLPLTLLEAFSYGLPAITFTDCIGASAVNNSDKCGCRVSTIQDLSRVIELWVSRSTAETMRPFAFERAKMYSNDLFFEKWTDLIVSVQATHLD